MLAPTMQAGVKIRPVKPVVTAGTALKFHANEPVDWSLAPGSAGTVDPDGTYHAPTSVQAKNALGGCQVLPNDHIFNTRVDALPLNPNSTDWIKLIPPSHMNYYPAWGTNIVDNTTPKRRMHFLYTPGNDGIFEIPEWPLLKQENGALSDPRSGLDRHILMINRQDCTFSEIYGNYKRGLNPQCADCTGQSGVRYSGTTYDLPNGATDAAGLPLAALSLHLEEITQGAVRHALRVTLSNGLIAPTHVWPATANAGPWGKIPYGTRFRLRGDISISRYSRIAKILLTQLKEYGLILADGGANWEVDGSTDVTEDPAVLSAFGEISHGGITSRDFEVVSESPLMSSKESGKVRPDNRFVKPDSFALVIAHSRRNPSDVAEMAITIRAVTVGIPDPAIWIQSGVTKKLDAWVSGSSDHRLQWTMEPTLGSITADGIYCAPEVTKPARTTLIVSSVADPAAKAFLLVTVVPKGPIRIDVGNATGAPETPHSYAPDYGPASKGQMWWRELGGEYSFSVRSDSWSTYAWPKIPDIGLYYTSRYSLGDMLFRFLVPNGNYRIRLMYAYPCKGTYRWQTEAPEVLEAQRKLIAQNFDWGATNGHACVTPTTFDMPATVTENSLEFALRRVTVRDVVPATALNAFSIERTAETPHIEMDPSHIPDMSAGQTLQFHAIGWFMDNSVRWSLKEGPGSISQSGLYAAPTIPVRNPQRVVVLATSTADTSKTASAEFTFTFGKLSLVPNETKLARGLEQRFKVDLNGVLYPNVTWSLSPSVGVIAPDGTYSAPEALEHDEDVLLSAESRDVPGKLASAKIHIKVTPDPIRINCGDSGPFRDAQGNLWSGDFGFSPSTGYHKDNIVIKNASPDMQPLYRSARYVYNNQSFFYTFKVPNGSYNVTLKFADYYHETPLANYFDVKLNGEQVLVHFNPTEVAGARTAIDKTFTVSVTNHSLRIDFIGKGGNPYISGIQILYSGRAR